MKTTTFERMFSFKKLN